jgi:hypothetical protein
MLEYKPKGLRPNTLSCIAFLLLVHYSHLCLYKGSLLYYIIQIIQYTDFSVFNKLKSPINFAGAVGKGAWDEVDAARHNSVSRKGERGDDLCL